MADILSVDLQAKNADKANAAVTAYRQNLVATDKIVNDLGAKSAFAGKLDSQIAATTARVQDLRAALRDTSLAASKSDAPIWKSYATGANQAATQARGLFTELKNVRAQAAATSDPKLFATLQQRAAAVSTQIDALDQKMRRVAAGRQAVADRLGQSGPGKFAGVANQASAFLPPEFQQALGVAEAAKAAGIVTTAGLATIAGVAAAGVALVKLSEKIKNDAQARLKIEEQIAITVNKQVIAAQEITKEFDKQRAAREKQVQFDKSLQGLDADALKRRRETLEKLFRLNPGGDNSKAFQSQIEQLDEAIRQSEKKAADASTASFEQRNENWKRLQESARQGEEFQREQIEKGKAKVKELGETWKATFDDLFAQRGADNPFVKLFTDADASIEKVRQSTAGLSDDLRAAAEQMQRTLNANALFSARIDNALAAEDLTADAKRFRRTGSTATADRRLMDVFERLRREERGGLFRNDSALITAAMAGAGNQSRLTAFDARRFREESGGLFRNEAFQDEQRRRLARDAANDPNASVQERLDRQLAIVASLRPENEAQRAEADRKIIALTQGLNPEQLTDTQRNAAAQARENEAARIERAEQSAREQRAEQLKTSQRIDVNIEALLKLAESEGLSGVIRIINEAEDKAKVSLGKRPKPSDTAATMDL